MLRELKRDALLALRTLRVLREIESLPKKRAFIDY